MKKILFKLIAPIIGAFLLFAAMPVTALADAGAAPYYGIGTTNGRTDTVNINDYHTSAWDRFMYNYIFHSGGDYRYDLGQPTTYTGFVAPDVYTANVRRDKNVSFTPPSYGVFSGNVATEPTNYLFDTSVNMQFWNAVFQANPDVIPIFDTLMMGVNAPRQGNPMNMHNVGQGGTLPNTSIGGAGISPIGANNATGQHFQQNDEWFYQSGNGSSTVTTPAHDGFLPPTSIK
jgi:hypothetical protein